MKPTIVIEEEVYRKVMHWVNKSQYEVSGLGTVRIEPNGVLRVVSAMLLPQKNGATHTDIEAEEVNKALFKLRDAEGDLKWWWHSHVQMGVFWSATDHDTIKKIGAAGWFAATVFNQKKEVRSAYYGAQGQVTPWGTEPLFLDELKTVLGEIPSESVAIWDAEYTENVSEPRKHVYDHNQYVYEGGSAGKTHGTTNGFGNSTIDVPKCTEVPPDTKPKGMPKKVYQKWRERHTEYIASKAQETFNMGGGRHDSQKLITDVSKPVLDDYGFDQSERAIFAESGWSESDFDSLIEDFSPTEILRMAVIGAKAQDISYIMHNFAYGAEDVIDLLEQSESFGESLFTTPTGIRGMYE